ncbi:CHASE3 domain-containing protein [Actinoplanes sp. NPDC048796]|uniref:CHASE3 domain-containing protein n=1 Tax=Actinoplanes sp. NPDC048796 TaxID=3155640 RepID=UPI0033EAB6B9
MTRRWREATYRPGRRWTAGRLPAVGYVASVGVLALAGTAAGVGIGAVLTESTSVDCTYQTLAALSDLRRQLADAQRGEQAFVLTADEHYLEPYTTAAAQVPPTLGELRVLIGAAHRRTIDDLQASPTPPSSTTARRSPCCARTVSPPLVPPPTAPSAPRQRLAPSN